MPPQVRKRLATEIVDALRDPEVAKQIAAFGWRVAADANPDEYDAFMKAEYERFGAIVKAKGIERDN